MQFCGVLAALGLFSGVLPAGSAQPGTAGEIAGAVETGPPGAPAEAFVEAQVLLESAWLVADEATGGVRLVPGPRPPGARERLYTARFRHGGQSKADGLQVTVAIPPDMRYVADSAVGPGAQVSFSIDGGRNFAPPAELSVPIDNVDANDPDRPGAPESATRRATADDYSHIRWRLAGEFLPGTAGLVSFRALTAQPEPEPEPEPQPDAEARPDPESAAPAGTR